MSTQETENQLGGADAETKGPGPGGTATDQVAEQNKEAANSENPEGKSGEEQSSSSGDTSTADASTAQAGTDTTAGGDDDKAAA